MLLLLFFNWKELYISRVLGEGDSLPPVLRQSSIFDSYHISTYPIQECYAPQRRNDALFINLGDPPLCQKNNNDDCLFILFYFGLINICLCRQVTI